MERKIKNSFGGIFAGTIWICFIIFILILGYNRFFVTNKNNEYYAENVKDLKIDSLCLSEMTIQSNIYNEQQREMQKSEKLVNNEMKKSVDDIEKTIMALEDSKDTAALLLLKNVFKELNTKHKEYLNDTFINYNTYSRIVIFKGTLEEAMKMNTSIKSLTVNEFYFKARRLLIDMKSEIQISTEKISYKTFLSAIYNAINLIEKENKPGEALFILKQAMTTIEIKDKIIPIPVLNAQYVVQEAEKIFERDNERALNLLTYAQYQLKLAKELGYCIENKEIKTINKHILDLKGVILCKGNKNSGLTEKLFKKVHTNLRRIREKIAKHGLFIT